MNIPDRPTQERIKVRAGDIRINSKCQRSVNETRAQHIADTWDWILYDEPYLARFPNGLIAAANGQHTLTGYIKKFGEDAIIECPVQDVADDTEFAALVKRLNPDPPTIRTWSRGDHFWIDLERGEQYPQLVINAFQSCGCDVARQKSGTRTFQCVPAIMSIYRVSGLTGLHTNVEFLSGVWQAGAINEAYMLTGCYLFLKHCGEDVHFNLARIADVLKSNVPLGSVVSRSKSIQKTGVKKARAFAMAIRDEYNAHNDRSPDIRVEIPEWSNDPTSKPPRRSQPTI